MTKAELKYLKSLLTKKSRRQENRFLAEGIRVLEESVKHRFRPVRIFYSESLLTDRSDKLTKVFIKQKVPVQAVTAREMNQFSETQSPQGLIGLFDIPRQIAKKTANRKQGRLLFLDNISDPGNAGTLIRSAAAFDFDLVLMTDESVEVFNPKVIRSSAGAVFAIPVVRIDYEELEFYKNNLGYYILGSGLQGIPLDRCRSRIMKSSRLLLAIGSEADGISPETRSFADDTLRLFHSRKVESLNAAVAGSLLMKEIFDLKNKGVKR